MSKYVLCLEFLFQKHSEFSSFFVGVHRLTRYQLDQVTDKVHTEIQECCGAHAHHDIGEIWPRARFSRRCCDPDRIRSFDPRKDRLGSISCSMSSA